MTAHIQRARLSIEDQMKIEIQLIKERNGHYERADLIRNTNTNFEDNNRKTVKRTPDENINHTKE